MVRDTSYSWRSLVVDTILIVAAGGVYFWTHDGTDSIPVPSDLVDTQLVQACAHHPEGGTVIFQSPPLPADATVDVEGKTVSIGRKNVLIEQPSGELKVVLQGESTILPRPELSRPLTLTVTGSEGKVALLVEKSCGSKER